MQAARAVAQGKADRGLRGGRTSAGSSPDNRALRSGGRHVGSVRRLLCSTNTLMRPGQRRTLPVGGLGPRSRYLNDREANGQANPDRLCWACARARAAARRVRSPTVCTQSRTDMNSACSHGDPRQPSFRIVACSGYMRGRALPAP